MKKHIFFIALAAILGGCTAADSDRREPIDYVDPFIGTGFHGHTYPGATYPFGAVQLSPDTRNAGWDACAGYHWDDDTIIGFSHTHLSGTGCADLADILFHPTSSEPTLVPRGYIFEPHRFSHDDEQASPGYYRVHFPEAGITAELTATRYTGVHRYTYTEGQPEIVIICLKHAIDGKWADKIELHQTAENEIAGMKRTQGWSPNNYTFFVSRFSRPIESVEFVCDGVVVPAGTDYPSNNVQVVVRFGTGDGIPLVAVTGISKVSEENARENLVHDVPHFDFDAVHSATRDVWRGELSRITVEGGTEDERKLFYTGMYRTRVVPNTMSDVNGQFRRHDMTIGQVAEGRTYYSTLSLWDTFRAWHPLMTLTDHKLTEDIIWSMLEMYDTTGELPIWPLACGETYCMIGYHSVSVIADAYMKGIRDFDAGKAFEAMKRSSNINRKGSVHYIKYGYIPSDLAQESVSCVLEYAYNDWCIARMAEALGHAEDAEYYYGRALNYVNIFDGRTGFFRPRKLNGNWDEPFNSYEPTSAYTEATPWQYRFFVPHDVAGHVQLFGSRERFIEALDDLFTTDSRIDGHVSDITGMIGQYAQGNEPSHHKAFLYNWAGQPWKTQEMTRRLLAEQYFATPEGISGNEDCGQMSAWYILTSLGFYSVCPGSNEFALTTPLFPRAMMNLANGNQLVITANNPARNKYIERVELNGREIVENFITYDQIMGGGELRFTLRRTPNRTRGTQPETFPYSQTTRRVVSVPYITSDISVFADEVTVEIGTTTDGARIYYTLDGSEPTESSTLFTEPVRITESATLRARAFKEGYEPSRMTHAEAVKVALREPDFTTLPAGMLSGVNYKYYEGRFTSVYEMLPLTPLDTGVMERVSLDNTPARHNFGYIFEGEVKIPEDGIYTFHLRSTDGSVLYIGDQKVIDLDGRRDYTTKRNSIGLRKGYHNYRILYFQRGGNYELTFRWALPGAEVFTEIIKPE